MDLAWFKNRHFCLFSTQLLYYLVLFPCKQSLSILLPSTVWKENCAILCSGLYATSMLLAPLESSPSVGTLTDWMASESLELWDPVWFVSLGS